MKDCGIIKDLLPLYAEELASEESAALVREHLETCEDCRKVYEQMKAPVETEPAAPLITVRKAVKKRGWLIAGLIACLVAALIFGAFARLTKPIPIHTTEEAFAQTEVVPETIPLPAARPVKAVEPEKPATPETPEKSEPTDAPEQQEDAKTDRETELVKEALQMIVVLINDEQEVEVRYMILEDGTVSEISHDEQSDPNALSKPVSMIGFTFRVDPNAETEQQPEPHVEAEQQPESSETVAYVYHMPNDETQDEKLEPDAVIVSTPKTLKLTAEKGVKLTQARMDGEISVEAYTTLWSKWFSKDAKPQETEITLSDVDAVFFEPYNNTERVALYQREGYAPEAGYALPRLVMNYYLLIALAGTAILAVAWLVLLLLKKHKARRVFGVLLLIAGSFVFAFLAAGFPATTIAPARELAFVCAVALLLIGAGLCGRKLLKKE